MSVVTDVILTTGLSTDVTLSDLNAWFAGEHGDAVLHKVDKPDDAPGKRIQADIFIGAFNYLDLDALVEHLRGLAWDDIDRSDVRLFVQEEHDEHGFHEVEIWPGRERTP